MAEESLREEYGLSDREVEIAALVCKGYDNPRIAKELFLSVATVKTHVSNVLRKTGTRNRFELMSLLGNGEPPAAGRPQPRKSFTVKRLILLLTAVAIIAAVPFVYKAAASYLDERADRAMHARQLGQEQDFLESSPDLLDGPIPAELDPLTVARLYYYYGAVKKDQELWKQTLTDDWSGAMLRSTWRMLAERDPGQEWTYYYLYTAEDEPDSKRFFFQRQVNGVDDRITPRPVKVVKQNGQWRVRSGNP